jgi:hypothetical protein
MKIDETKMMLAAPEAESVRKVHATAVGELLDPLKPRANVRGIGVGVKWKNGQPIGEPALLVLVTHKLANEELSEAEMVPAKVGGMQTDVLAIGDPMAGDHGTLDGGIQTLAKRVRPAKGGYSVGHKDITAGTISTCVYDILPGGSTTPPSHGVGIPPKFYILSNNHVLANTNAGLLGDAILQPGPFDGGVDPADRIATLSRFIPINFAAGASNLVDCARRGAVPRSGSGNLLERCRPGLAAEGGRDGRNDGEKNRAHHQPHHRQDHGDQRHHHCELRRREGGAIY